MVLFSASISSRVCPLLTVAPGATRTSSTSPAFRFSPSAGSLISVAMSPPLVGLAVILQLRQAAGGSAFSLPIALAIVLCSNTEIPGPPPERRGRTSLSQEEPTHARRHGGGPRLRHRGWKHAFR